jgi:hypothetical protein
MGIFRAIKEAFVGYKEPDTLLKGETVTLESLHEVIEALGQKVLPGIDSSFVNDSNKILKQLKDLETKIAQRLGFMNYAHFKSMEQESGERHPVRVV